MLLLVFTAAAAALLLLRSIRFRLRRQRSRAFSSFRTAVILVSGYMFTLLVVSMASHQRELPVGFSQCFGDWCAVVTRTQVDGTQALVVLSLHNQGNAPQLRPEEPTIRVLDPTGRRIAPRAESGPPFGQTLKPGETVTKEFQFEIPGDMQYPMVWITEGGWVTRFLIGGGNSFLHRKEVTLLQ